MATTTSRRRKAGAARSPARLKTGLAAWIDEVVAQHARVRRALRADPVHDLRVAIRRVRSLAQGLRSIDDDVGAARWRALSDAGKPLFAGLGELRDAQVMRDHALTILAGEPAAKTVLASIDGVVRMRLVAARAAVDAFRPTAWRAAGRGAPERAAALLAERPLFVHLGLRRLQEAHALHHEAMRSRASTALHACRIGVKKLRYTVENFLPEAHAQVGKLLKKMQEVLGELHDLDVLLAFVGSEDTRLHSTERGRVGALVRAARDQRLAAYRTLCAHGPDGAAAAWHRLRAALADDVDVAGAHRAFVARRAAGRGAGAVEVEHAQAAAAALRGALAGHVRAIAAQRATELLRLACTCALVRDDDGTRSGRAAWRFARRLPVAHGLPERDLRVVGLLARAAFGELPRLDEQRVAALGVRDARLVVALAPLLPLAMQRAGVSAQPARPNNVRALPAHRRSRSPSGKRAAASARASRSQA
ncbi:MAG: CHAD domain-containing protein [Deltaproteobacteria bacterium]|nr:CHAD domain-containing protein [Deltaproteobacteria bacterium]